MPHTEVDFILKSQKLMKVFFQPLDQSRGILRIQNLSNNEKKTLDLSDLKSRYNVTAMSLTGVKTLKEAKSD